MMTTELGFFAFGAKQTGSQHEEAVQRWKCGIQVKVKSKKRNRKQQKKLAWPIKKTAI
jgi:hypothetical protein